MKVFVIVDWDNEDVLAVYKTKEDANTHVENECDEGDDVTVEEMVILNN